MIHIQNGKDLYSDEYQDIYFSREGGLEEKNYVFLDANDAENRFKNSDRIRILELGFGAGLNFTVTV
ncbi:MAG TPA: FAD-dependent cmnm(5)s(2)U34 oxidoreductase, partial [Leptospiraceae bacterium]|nr:FAD-dependent cmnm(5)s(2)U34 oxidoreductase [Leptospiraceae bacterium]